MKVFRQVRFNEGYVPPRCRKEQYRVVTQEVTGEIREITRDEAPLAIIQHGHSSGHIRVGISGRIEYHWYAKHLFARVRLSQFLSLNGKKDRVAIVHDIWWGDEWIGVATPAQAQKRFEDQVALYLLIDDKLFMAVGEPMYCVYASGLGGNHSSTFLSVDHYYNSNIPWNMYERCDQLEKALKLHETIALGRGDTKSVPSRHHATFEILIPKAVRRNPKKDYGGKGDAFINRCQGIISGMKSPMMAGLGVMVAALKSK